METRACLFHLYQCPSSTMLFLACCLSKFTTARWPDFKRRGATFGGSQPASCWFTFPLHFQLHVVLPRCLSCGEGVQLSTVCMWPGCYSITLTSSLQAWFQEKEKVSLLLQVCHFVSLFTGGIAGISCVDPVFCCCCLSPSQFLQDMAWRHGSEKVLTRQPCLQDIGLKSSDGAGGIWGNRGVEGSLVPEKLSQK